MSCPIRSRRFPRQLFENAIELRQRLKPDRECDFADAKIDIMQKGARFFEPCAGDVIDKIYTGHLLELFAQMIRADVDRVRHLTE